MRRVALATIVVVLGGCISGAVMATREWLAEDDRACTDWCALDVDASCGGEARELSACVTACRASEDGLCAGEYAGLHACEAKLTCDDYRGRHAKGGPCEGYRAAAEACDAAR